MPHSQFAILVTSGHPFKTVLHFRTHVLVYGVRALVYVNPVKLGLAQGLCTLEFGLGIYN